MRALGIVKEKVGGRGPSKREGGMGGRRGRVG